VGGGEEPQVLDHGSESLWALTADGIYFKEMNGFMKTLHDRRRLASLQVADGDEHRAADHDQYSELLRETLR
jgi:hypothetical protein